MALPIVELDRPRRLKFGVTAAREYKARFGVPLVAALRSATAEEVALDLDWATNVLWAALRHEDATLTPDKTAALLDRYIDGGGSIQALYSALGEAYTESLKSFTGDEEGKAAGTPAI